MNRLTFREWAQYTCKERQNKNNSTAAKKKRQYRHPQHERRKLLIRSPARLMLKGTQNAKITMGSLIKIIDIVCLKRHVDLEISGSEARA